MFMYNRYSVGKALMQFCHIQSHSERQQTSHNHDQLQPPVLLHIFMLTMQMTWTAVVFDIDIKGIQIKHKHQKLRE